MRPHLPIFHLCPGICEHHYFPLNKIGLITTMRRLRAKLLWTILLIAIMMQTTEGLSISKRASSSLTSTATESTLNSTSKRPSGKPKASSRRKTTTTSSAESISTTKRPSNRQKQEKVSTTTLSPDEIMNRLYQMHGMASHGVSLNHAAYHSSAPSSSTSSSSSSSKKKEQQQSSSSMDDIYRLHALAIAQGSHGGNKNQDSSSASSSSSSASNSKTPSKDTSNSKQSSHSKNHMESIYQQHSSMPSSMHHIMAQHSHISSSRPQKESSNVQESSSLSSIMQPLLKQLTPVGAGISVVLAPLLLFNGFLTFFSNMSRFLNNFAQTILPVRRPTQNPQNYFQGLGPDHLQRQPRDWMNPNNLKDIHQFAQLLLKAVEETQK